jgi:DNA-binding NtrC family response regulator
VKKASARPRVLVVDDDDGVLFTLGELLGSQALDVTTARDGAEALLAFDRNPVPLVVTDLRMPKLDGMGLLAALQQRPNPPRVIVITAHGSERQAVEAMKAGAYDYFRKPFDNDELGAVVGRALDHIRLGEENERLQGELALSRTLVFDSEAMRRLSVLVSRVAPRDTTVLISGESGTGKERVAEAIVRASSRSSAPYVRFNCAVLSPELVEAELFGHAKGAFTGAHRARPGLFREADGGTLLLDEVGELDLATQAKLLRVLQESEVRAVGEEQSRKIDVRILAATHKNLETLVQTGAFRDDLYYRLAVVKLEVPPLRDRKEDIALLTRFFLGRHAERFGLGHLATTPELVERLCQHDWPGNVRELENALENLVVLSPPEALDLDLLPFGKLPSPEAVSDSATPTSTSSSAIEPPLDGASLNSREPPLDGASLGSREPHLDRASLHLREHIEHYERRLILEALRQTGGNRSLAAQRLGISRVTLHDKLNKYGIKRGEDGDG